MELASRLRKFYAEARTQNGNPYKRSALQCIRAALQRHITQPPYNRKINIVRNDDFMQANNLLTAVVQQNREAGLENVDHKVPIAEKDYEIMVNMCNINTPEGLQNKVFLDFMKHFGRRGSEGLRAMNKIKTFKFQTCPVTGIEYVQIGISETQKNYRENRNPTSVSRKRKSDQSNQDRLMAASQYEDDPYCPVANLRSYISHLHPNRDDFWQKPKTKNFHPENKVWYDNAAVGKDPLGLKLRTLSTAALEFGCTQIYTNHCIRATTSTGLGARGIRKEELKHVTGHKNESSLDPYVGGPTIVRRIQMSHMLNDYGRRPDPKDRKKNINYDKIGLSPVSAPSTVTSSSKMESPIQNPQVLSLDHGLTPEKSELDVTVEGPKMESPIQQVLPLDHGLTPSTVTMPESPIPMPLVPVLAPEEAIENAAQPTVSNHNIVSQNSEFDLKSMLSGNKFYGTVNFYFK